MASCTNDIASDITDQRDCTSFDLVLSNMLYRTVHNSHYLLVVITVSVKDGSSKIYSSI